MGVVTQSYYDFSQETSSISVTVDNADVGGVEVQSLLSAVAAIWNGTGYKVQQSPVVANSGITPRTNPFAQRELRSLCKFKDDVNGKSVQLEIPCPDLTGNIS